MSARPADLIIGLDIGTTSISAVAVSSGGVAEAVVTQPHAASVAGLPTDCAEQDPERLWDAVVRTLRHVAAEGRGRRVVGLGMTGQMHSTVLLDAHGQCLHNVITWQDRRSSRTRPAGATGVSVADAVAGDAPETLLQQLQAQLSEKDQWGTGCRLSAGYLGSTLFALRQLGELPARLASVAFVADWLGARLTGCRPVTDRTHAASSGLYDLVLDDWSDALLQATGIARAWLPDVRPSGDVVGRLTALAAELTDLPVGTPVGNAVGDHQAAVLSVLPDEAGVALINIGTGGQIAWRIPEFTRCEGLETRWCPADRLSTTMAAQNLVAGGTCLLAGAELTGGDTVAWLHRAVHGWLSAFGVTLSDTEIRERLQQLLSEPRAADGLICEPYFRGSRRDPARTGTLRGITADNFTPAGVASSVLEGLARSLQTLYLSAGTAAAPLQRVLLSGNAARLNPALQAAVQRCFGVPVQLAPQTEEAATGAALLIGRSLGLWPTLAVGRRLLAEHAATGELATSSPVSAL